MALEHESDSAIARAVRAVGSQSRFARELTTPTRSGQPWRTTSLLLSTNVRFTASGARDMNVSRRDPDDPGAAFYFDLDRRPHVLACDRWDAVPDNSAAIAAHIDALRGQERWGVADLRQAFAGHVALPAPGMATPRAWWRVLGLPGPEVSRHDIEVMFRRLAAQHHPDRGGSAERMKHALDFLEYGEETGGLYGAATSCAIACGKPFITAFRAWSKDQPVHSRNGKGEITRSRPRAAATTEESVLQIAASLNHAVNADPPRSERRPVYKPLPRKQVSRPRKVRVDVPVLADMLAYAAEPAKKRASLHAFIVASLCTIGRPDAVVDINVAPDREQWYPGSPTLDLNPFGRAQTNKHRPVIPVLPVLAEWLAAELAAYQTLDEDERAGAGFLVNYYGRGVLDVDRAWATMLREPKLPSGREWKPYLLRHSLATIVRNRGVEKWDLEGFMGHDVTGSTEVYAKGRFATVARALEEIMGDIDARAPGALRRNRAEVGLPGLQHGRLKMTG